MNQRLFRTIPEPVFAVIAFFSLIFDTVMCFALPASGATFGTMALISFAGLLRLHQQRPR
jgi:hypothetical protein